MRERPAQSTSPADPPFHVVMRNGYTYSIDPGGRTRQVSGYLTLATTPMRSRVSQLRAGGADCRRTDEGGHYIAVRFNGPTEAFNHFAQDRTFNRSGYRQLENQWAKARRAGERVFVRLNPVYSARSLRPDRISVYYTIDGMRSGALSLTATWRGGMSENKDELTLQRIGMILNTDLEYSHQDTLLLSKLARNMISTSIFKNLGNQILYRRELLEEFDWVLLDFWGEQKGRHRWAEIEYLMRGGQFTVRYVYPDEVDNEEDPLDRRTRTVRCYFGDKPIVYPPWENDGSDFGV